MLPHNRVKSRPQVVLPQIPVHELLPHDGAEYELSTEQATSFVASQQFLPHNNVAIHRL